MPMNIPERIDLPFFSYGIFKPGQLGFFQLREFIDRVQPNASIYGNLLERDGLPILNENEIGTVKGILIYFNCENSSEAYQKIVKMGPHNHYKWGIIRVTVENPSDELLANVLLGRDLGKGSVPYNSIEWDGSEDPLFTSALEVVQETLEQNSTFETNLKPLFRLQMAYLLLWSAIERYVTLRYCLDNRIWVSKKVKKLTSEREFFMSLQQIVKRPRIIHRADRPQTWKKLDPLNPVESVEYYYTVRSNITHRGKAAEEDFKILEKSLTELLKIFKNVLNAVFKESSNDRFFNIMGETNPPSTHQLGT